MTSESIPQLLTWESLYHIAMLEPDSARLPSLLEDAIHAVLDQIEETWSQREMEELNNALNALRLRRREVSCLKSGCTSNQTRAA